MDQGEPIPPSLMAKLLKFKLLHVKQKDLERREEEKKVDSYKLSELYISHLSLVAFQKNTINKFVCVPAIFWSPKKTLLSPQH